MLRGGYSMNVLTIFLYDNGTVSEIGPLMNNQKGGGPEYWNTVLQLVTLPGGVMGDGNCLIVD